MENTVPDKVTTDTPTPAADDVKGRVIRVLEQIRPAIQADGGDLEFISLEDDGVVLVRLHGACVGCPSANATLKLGVERYVKEEVPEIKSVECVN